MPLEAHWSRQQSPLGARERRVAVALLAALAACAAVLVLALAGSSGGSAPGCVDATIASTTGGAAVHACGDTARRMCAAPGRTHEIRVACRRAGY